ncbi:MAG: DUF1566 domain-containing protein, partial [Deltaproteobacteria bacterium]|nr:DUF1566 domain-containing protein [Deltaproteobacteria bacterium]
TNPATIKTCDTSSDGACSITSCQPQTGSCSKAGKPAGTACDDGVACTTGDICDGKGGCTPGTWTCCKSDADCAGQEDGDFCNGTLFCNLQSGACELNPKTVVSCPTVDDTACRQRVCQPKTGQCPLVPVQIGKACDDGNACSDGDVCDAKGHCKPGTDICPCKVDGDCAAKDDGDLCNGTLYCNPVAGPGGTGVCKPNPKTVVSCPSVDDTSCRKNVCDKKKGVCGLVDLPTGVTCDADGTACTAGDGCDGKGGCAVGEAVCGCQGDADCAGKDDGDLCNGTLFCDKSGQQPTCKVNPATVVSCSQAGIGACKVNVCLPTTGSCVVQPELVGAPCDDGDACSGPDACNGKGQCVDGPSLCGCKVDPDCAIFDDGDVCNGGQACVAGGCKATAAPKCDDGNECTTDACDASGGCNNTPVQLNTPCKDDGIACTFDACDALAACKHALVGCLISGTCHSAGPNPGNSCQKCISGQSIWTSVSGSCDDGDNCTDPDTCVGGACKGGAKACDDGQPCTVDTCDKVKGCLFTAQEGVACEDGDPCTAGDVCASGVCKTGAATDCSDDNACTTDACDTASGGCTHLKAKDGAGCVDVFFGAGMCASGGCATPCTAANTGKPCVSGDLCMPHGACNPAQVCEAAGTATVMTWVGKGNVGTHKTGALAQSGLGRPWALAHDQKRRLYLADYYAYKISYVEDGALHDLAGSSTGFADGSGTEAAFGWIESLVVAPDGDLRVGDGARLRRVTPTGKVTTLWNPAVGLKDGPLATAMSRKLGGLTYDSKGRLYFADMENHVIRFIESGEVVTLAGQGKASNADGKGSTAGFNLPGGIAIHPDSGDLYIADIDGNRIRRLQLDGTVTTIAGSGQHGYLDGDLSAGVASVKFAAPASLLFDAQKRLLIADQHSNRIRRLTLGGKVETIAGTGTQAKTNQQKDGVAIQATFGSPIALAMDPYGRVYVADVFPSVVRVLFRGAAEMGPQDGTPCDDGVMCTTDTCKSGKCTSTPNDCGCGPDTEPVVLDNDGVATVACAAQAPIWGKRATSPPSSLYTVAEPVDGKGKVVTDSQTKLMWTQGTTASALSLTAAAAICDASSHGGFGDWRLPTVHELATLVDYAVAFPGPSLDGTVFSGSSGGKHWTATPRSGMTSHAWFVDFTYGGANTSDATLQQAVRCVRNVGSVTAPAKRYTISGDGLSVTDAYTGLIWERKVVGGKNWTGAASHCAGTTTSGKTGWRLPTVAELWSLIDPRFADPPLDPTAFPGASAGLHWTVTPRAGSADKAWALQLAIGYSTTDDAVNQASVRCVHDP